MTDPTIALLELLRKFGLQLDDDFDGNKSLIQITENIRIESHHEISDVGEFRESDANGRLEISRISTTNVQSASSIYS